MKPKIRLANNGTGAQTPGCIFHGFDSTGTEVYTDTQSTTLAAGEIVDLEFDRDWSIDSGNYSCFVERYTPPDQWSPNDTMSKSFFVKAVFTDIRVVAITSPTGAVREGSIPVTAQIQSGSWMVVDCDVMFQIFDELWMTELYNDTVTVSGIMPNDTQNLIFTPWTCSITGTYHGFVRNLTPDAEPDNDTFSNTFQVVVGIPGQWVKKADLVFGDKPVGKGGCLAFFSDSGWVYALKGNNKPAFGRYSIEDNAWTQLADMPLAWNREKRPKGGAAIVRFGNYLFATKGGNRLEWWRYGLPGADSIGWKQLTDVPAGEKKVKGGTVLAAVKLNDTDYIFMAKGSKTSEAYLFNLATNLWGPALSGVPLFDKSTAGCGFNESLVYAITFDKGTKTNPIFLGNLKTNTWVKTAEVPMVGLSGKQKKIKEGAALTNDGTQFYMFKGGNVKEFYDYTPGENVMQRADIPLTTKKGVKGGAALTYGNGYVWALPGNKLNEFWQYMPILPTVASVTNSPSLEGVLGNKVAFGAFKLGIAPNPAINATTISYSLPVPGLINFKLFNVTGALVKSFTNTTPTKDGVLMLDTRTLASGVYLLRFDAGDIRVTRKLVLEK